MARNDVYVTADFTQSRDPANDFDFTISNGLIQVSAFAQFGDDADATFWGADVNIGTLWQAAPHEAHLELLGKDIYVGLGAPVDLYGSDVTSAEYHIENINVNRQEVGRTPNELDWWSAQIVIADEFTNTATGGQTLWIDDIQLDYAQAFLYFESNTLTGGGIEDYDYHVTISDLGIAVNNVDEYFANGEDDIAPDTTTNAKQWDVIDLTDLGITSADQLVLDSVVWGNSYGKTKSADKQIVEKIDFHYTDGEGHDLHMSLKDVQLLMKGATTGGLLADDTPAGNPFWSQAKGSVITTGADAGTATTDSQLEDIWQWIRQYSLHLENNQNG
jgi:hypothetical protein